jgi:hypothetical protein
VPLHPSVFRRSAPVVGSKKKVNNPGANASRERKVLGEMTKKTKAASVYEQLAPADEQEVREFFAGIHARLRLWRRCRRRTCRRLRSCGGNLEACGARLAPQHWKWMHHFAQALLHAGSPRAAVRAADRHMLPRRIIMEFGLGPPAEFIVNEDGSRTNIARAPPPFRFGGELKRLAAAVRLSAAPAAEVRPIEQEPERMQWIRGW